MRLRKNFVRRRYMFCAPALHPSTLIYLSYIKILFIMYVPPRSKPRTGEQLSPASLDRRKRKSKRQAGEFIRGPIPVDWITAAAALPGKALALAVLIQFLAGIVTEPAVIRLRPSQMDRFGISRHAGYRALNALESARLVSVSRQRGCAAEVKICKAPQRRGRPP